MNLAWVKLHLDATRATEHRRLIETFTLRSMNGEAVLQVIRQADGKRVEAGGQASLFARSPEKGRAFMADLGAPCERPAGDLRAFAFPIVLLDSGVDDEGGTWRGLKFQISHGGGFCEGTLTVRTASAELSVRSGEDVFWSIARIALGEGVAPRSPRPAVATVTSPELLRGVESLRLIPGHRQLLGLDTRGSLFTWGDLGKKPRRVVNLELTITAINAAPHRVAACGVSPATGSWRVVTLDLQRPRVETVVESTDDFPFMNARLMLSPDGKQLAMAWESELRIYEGTTLKGRVVHDEKLIPRIWSGDRLVVETAAGERCYVPGEPALLPVSGPTVHRRGHYELEAHSDGRLHVRDTSGSERVFEPALEADRRCIRALAHGRPRWLGDHHLLLLSDRLVALDLRSFETWVVIDGPDTQLRALLEGKTLVVEQQASGRAKYVEVRAD